MSNENEVMKTDFLDEVAGEGLDSISQQDTQQGLLLIAQKTSRVVEAGLVEVGHWYNSLTQEDYGSTVKVVVLAIEKYWFVWAADQSGLQGRYEPNSIRVTGDTYTGMTDESGNRVIDTLCYACILPDHPEAGVVVMTSTRGSMKYLRAWNSMMKTRRLPSGKPAPLYGTVWELSTTADQDKKGRSFFSLKGGFKPVSFIQKELFSEVVTPARALASNSIKSIEVAPETEAEPTAF